VSVCSLSHSESYSTECHFTVILLSVILLNVILLSVIMHRVIKLGVVLINVVAAFKTFQTYQRQRMLHYNSIKIWYLTKRSSLPKSLEKNSLGVRS